jgi:MYXO-CTERM domain-containing protein
MFKYAIISTTALATMFAATDALADTTTAPFDPAITERVAEFPWDSGYVPSSGPLRVKLGALAHQDVTVEMAGDAVYDWDHNALAFHGETGGGTFANALGAEITATIAIDIFGWQTEFEIGIWDLLEELEDNFTPYVLEGNVEDPITLVQLLGPYNLVDQPFTVGSATGKLVIDWKLDVPGMTFSGTRIDVADDGTAPPVASIVEEHQVVGMNLPGAEPGGTATAYGTQHGVFNSEVALHLMPYVELEYMGVVFTIGPFDMELAYPLITDREFAFDQLQMDFGVPLAPPEEDEDEDDDDGDGDGDDGDGADDDGGDEPDDRDDDEPEPEPEPEEPEATGGDGSGVSDGGGCGCTAGSEPVPGALMSGLLGLALISLRRRRC